MLSNVLHYRMLRNPKFDEIIVGWLVGKKFDHFWGLGVAGFGSRVADPISGRPHNVARGATYIISPQANRSRIQFYAYSKRAVYIHTVERCQKPTSQSSDYPSLRRPWCTSALSLPSAVIVYHLGISSFLSTCLTVLEEDEIWSDETSSTHVTLNPQLETLNWGDAQAWHLFCKPPCIIIVPRSTNIVTLELIATIIIITIDVVLFDAMIDMSATSDSKTR